MMRSTALLLVILLTPLVVAMAESTEELIDDTRGPDPSGVWESPIGHLILVRAGDTLSFSYLAVFGDTAHICDGLGVAGHSVPNQFEWLDDAGRIVFHVAEDEIRIEVVEGVVSFCGAGFAGDTLHRDASTFFERCRVVSERAHFHIVDSPLPPQPRRGYVIAGDVVEVLSLVNESSPAWVLARFAGPDRTTAGLLARDDLDCEPTSAE